MNVSRTQKKKHLYNHLLWLLCSLVLMRPHNIWTTKICLPKALSLNVLMDQQVKTTAVLLTFCNAPVQHNPSFCCFFWSSQTKKCLACIFNGKFLIVYNVPLESGFIYTSDSSQTTECCLVSRLESRAFIVRQHDPCFPSRTERLTSEPLLI